MVYYVLFVLVPIYQSNNSSQLINLFTMESFAMLFMTIVAPLVTTLALFSHQFSLRVSTAYHSFPVNKKQLFCTNIAAGLILMLVPLLILCLILLISPFYYLTTLSFRIGNPIPVALFPNGMVHGMRINSPWVVTGFFMRTAISFAFYFAVFTMAASVAGNKVITILLSISFPFVPAGIYILAEFIGHLFVFGYAGFNSMSYAEGILIFTNAAAWTTAYLQTYTPTTRDIPPLDTALYLYYISYTLITLVLLAGACTCMHKRKQERAGDSVVFYGLKNVLVFILSFLGMIAMGMFFLNLVPHSIALFFGFALGFVMTYFIAQMIAEKTFNIRHKVRYVFHFGGVMIGLCVGLALFTRIGFVWYENYIPNASAVAGIKLSHTSPPNLASNDLPKGGDHASSSATAPLMITDPEIIAQTLGVHRQIVNDKSRLRGLTWQEMIEASKSRRSIGGNAIVNQYIAYQLHNGRVIHRCYPVRVHYADAVGLIDLTLDERVVLFNRPILLQPWEVSRIRVTHSAGQGSNNRQYTETISDDAAVLSAMNALKNDVMLEVIDRNNRFITAKCIEHNRTKHQYLIDIGVLEPLPRNMPPLATHHVDIWVFDQNGHQALYWEMPRGRRNQSYFHAWLHQNRDADFTIFADDD
jgi:ABC-2 type transport system permease protein